MSKLIGVIWIAVLLFPIASAQSDHFSKYKAIEAYEIRPGILMMPRYAEDGRVCEVGLEPRHYTPHVVKTNPSLPRQMIDEIVDELAPAAERGSRTGLMGGKDIILLGGLTVTTVVEYENLSVQIASRDLQNYLEYVAVTIQWKNRKCK